MCVYIQTFSITNIKSKVEEETTFVHSKFCCGTNQSQIKLELKGLLSSEAKSQAA